MILGLIFKCDDCGRKTKVVPKLPYTWRRTCKHNYIQGSTHRCDRCQVKLETPARKEREKRARKREQAKKLKELSRIARETNRKLREQAKFKELPRVIQFSLTRS